MASIPVVRRGERAAPRLETPAAQEGGGGEGGGRRVTPHHVTRRETSQAQVRLRVTHPET
jgi:hypothetical protein